MHDLWTGPSQSPSHFLATPSQRNAFANTKGYRRMHFETPQAIGEEMIVASRCMYVASDPM